MWRHQYTYALFNLLKIPAWFSIKTRLSNRRDCSQLSCSGDGALPLGKTACFQPTPLPPSADFNWRCRLRQNKFCVKTACFCFSPKFPENGSVLPAVSATPSWPPRKHVSHPSLTQSSIHFHFLFNYSIYYLCVSSKSDAEFNSLSLSFQLFN